MGIDLYYTVLSPPARAVAILGKHLKIEINYKDINVHAGETKTPEYLKLNPSHTVPTLVDNGFALFESRAILQYLANKYAAGNAIYPSDPVARAQVDKVLFYDASGFFPAMRAAIIPKFRLKTEPSKEVIDELKEKIQILEAILGDQQFFAGDQVTIADISLGVEVPFLKMVLDPASTSEASPKLKAWYERLSKAVPALAELNGEAKKLYQERFEAESKK